MGQPVCGSRGLAYGSASGFSSLQGPQASCPYPRAALAGGTEGLGFTVTVLLRLHEPHRGLALALLGAPLPSIWGLLLPLE